MKRAQLEHVIAAAATIADDDEIIVIGSQAILGQFPDAPAELLISMEADVFPRNKPERADVIDGAIGELSMFHETFGYYAQGVGEDTAVLPAGWRDRLVRVSGRGTRGATGWCLEVHDLAVAKLIAGPEKDLDFVGAPVGRGMIDLAVITERLRSTALDDDRRDLAAARIARLPGSRPDR